MKKEDSGLAGLGRLIEYGLVNKKYPLAYTCGTPGGFSTVGLSLGARHCVLASLRTPAEQSDRIAGNYDQGFVPN